MTGRIKKFLSYFLSYSWKPFFSDPLPLKEESEESKRKINKGSSVVSILYNALYDSGEKNHSQCIMTYSGTGKTYKIVVLKLSMRKKKMQALVLTDSNQETCAKCNFFISKITKVKLLKDSYKGGNPYMFPWKRRK